MSVCIRPVLTDFAVFVGGPRGAPLADRGGVIEVRVSGGRRLADEARPLLVVAPLPHAQLVPRPVDRLVVAVSLAVPRPEKVEKGSLQVRTRFQTCEVEALYFLALPAGLDEEPESGGELPPLPIDDVQWNLVHEPVDLGVAAVVDAAHALGVVLLCNRL